LPALDLVKRIAATDKRTSFVGSDFFYEDVSGRSITEDTHELLETTKNYYVLKNTPKHPESVEFSYFKMWIHRQTFIPVKTEYYNKQKEKYRVYEALKVDTIQGYPTVTKSRMKDLRTKGETVIEYSNVQYNIDLPDNIFSERYLRRAPKKYLNPDYS
jgi:outer membrane lipoprotein-sorting protein